jgi:hypothetical protein
MNYNEVSGLLVQIGAKAGIRVYQTDHSTGLAATALYVIPVQWFVALDLSGQLNVGVYDGPDLRLVGTRQILFADLTPVGLVSLVEGAIVTKMILNSVQP